MKTCRTCEVAKPVSDFRRHSATADGFSYYCRACASAREAASYRRRRESAGKSVRPRRNVPAGLKFCPSCETVKPTAEFKVAPKQSGGFSSYCRPCNNRKQSEYRYRRVYGMTKEQIELHIVAQRGMCAICRQQAAEHVDHDHESGDFRGVLCFPCNSALGQVKDSTATLRNMIDYLERTTWQRHQEAPGVYRLTSPHRRAASPSSSALRHLISSRRG